MIISFADNFKNYFPVYENRHSPILYIILSFFKKAGLDFESIRFLHFHINLITLIFTYKCIQIKYPEIKKFNILFLSTVIIILSPSLRTAGYWPLPYPLGMLFINFFYYCLKFLHTKSSDKEKLKYILLNIIFLALSSYISPNFAYLVFILLILF